MALPPKKLPTRPSAPRTTFNFAKPTAAPKRTNLPPALNPAIGMSATELLRSTVGKVREAAVNDEVHITSRAVSKDKRKYKFKTVSGKSRSQYVQTVENRDPNTDNMKRSKKLIVHCTCEYFKYTCDWVLHQAGASDLESASDDAPDIKNPKRIKTLCKHLYVCVSAI